MFDPHLLTGPLTGVAWPFAQVSLSLGVVGGIATRTIVAALAGLWLASACRQLNESHCGNQDGSATCMQRDATLRSRSRRQAAWTMSTLISRIAESSALRRSWAEPAS